MQQTEFYTIMWDVHFAKLKGNLSNDLNYYLKGKDVVVIYLSEPLWGSVMQGDVHTQQKDFL